MLATLRDGNEQENQRVSIQKTDYACPDSFLHWVGSNDTRVYVPDLGDLRIEMIKYFQDTGHLGIDKVYNSCDRQAFWPKILIRSVDM